MSGVLAMTTAVILGVHAVGTPDEIDRRFAAGCVDGRWAPACAVLEREIETRLYGEIRQLARAHVPLDREVLRIAAGAGFVPLARFGLRALARITDEADREVALAALDHRSRAVREQARTLLANDPDRRARDALRWWPGSSSWRDAAGLGLDAVPEPASLGLAPIAAGLRYRAFASAPGRAVYSTRLPASEVLAAIASGREVLDGGYFGRSADSGASPQADMAELQRRMMEAIGRNDNDALEKIQQTMLAKIQGTVRSAQVAANVQPVRQFADQAAVRYFAGERRADQPQRPPPSYAVGTDPAFDGTVIVVLYPVR
ncbi:MAG: hypothetical protein R3E48_18515 [Burkholderiaceae bacterium]